MKSCLDRKGSADRGGDKKTNMAVDWQNTEETRQTSGQDNSLMDPTGESQTHLATTGNTSAVRRLRHTLKRTGM